MTNLKYYTLLLFLLNSKLIFTQTVFGSQQSITDNMTNGIDYPDFAITADIDNDGDNDIITHDNDNMVWFENIGNGQIGTKHVMIDSISWVSEMLAVDIDGDSDLDIISASLDTEWFENDGTGNIISRNFIYDQTLTGSGSNASSIDAVDIDGDGDLDLLTSSRFDDKILWFENDGSGNFGTENIISDTAIDALDVKAGDLDGDGDNDIVASFNSRLYRYLNDGMGNFGTGFLFAVSPAEQLELLDTDLDGDLDVVSMFGQDSYVANQLAYYKNDGNGGFGTEVIIGYFNNPYQYPFVEEGLSTFDLEDIDQDGDIDLCIFIGGQRELVWFENDGNGDFLQQNIIDSYNKSATYTTSVDMDNDNIPDIVTVSKHNHSISWYKNLGTGIFGDENRLVSDVEGDAEVIAVDLDNDGDLDAVSVSYLDGKLAWYENDGVGNFGAQKIIDIDIDKLRKITSGDIDGDGLGDLIVSTDGANATVYLYKNLTNGNFSSSILAQTANTNGYAFSYILTGDIDNDGDIDIATIFYDPSDYSITSWFENDGTGNSFNEHVIYNDADIYYKGFYLADFDGDNDLDLLASDYLRSALHKNNGSGNFGPPDSLATVNFIDVLDVDSDNDLDIIARGSGDNYILFNDGLGAFQLQYYNYFSDDLVRINHADFDNDGDQDIISASSDFWRDTLTFHENDGVGNFEIGQFVAINTDNSLFNMEAKSIFPADLDNDGDLDFLATIYQEDKIAWYMNLLEKPTVTGTTYWDVNADGIYNQGDYPIPGQVSIDPGAIVEIGLSTGSYQLYLEEGDYNISANPIPDWILSTDTSYTVEAMGSVQYSNYDFGFLPTDTIIETVAHISSDLTLCSEVSYFHFSWINTGTTIINGSAVVSTDEWLSSAFYGSNPPDSIINSSQFIWEFDSLFPGHSISKTISFYMPGVADGFIIGDSIQIQMDVYSESLVPLTGLIHNNTQLYEPVILCSYDPNDKLVQPDRGDNNLTLLEEPLVYTIRFQNTGNYFATDIVLRDTLDPNLDPSTLRILACSHESILQTNLEQNQYLTFTFENIMLPHSDEDFVGSQGYVSYVIEPYSGLSVGTEIENTAYIYFDANPPIITNTTNNQLTDEIINGFTQLEDCDSFMLDGQFYYESFIIGDTTCIYNGCIIDNLTEIIIYTSTTEEEEIEIVSGDIYTLPDGTMVGEAGEYNSTLTTINDCDSVIVTILSILSNTTSHLSTDLNWIISPNPTTGIFVVSIPSNTQPYQIRIFNSLSQNIYEGELTEERSFDLGKWTSGIYYIFICDKSGSIIGGASIIKI